MAGMTRMTRIRIEAGLGWVGDQADLLCRITRATGFTTVMDFNGDDLIAAPGSYGSKVWSDWIDRRRARQGPDEPLLPRRQPEEKGGWGAPEREVDRDVIALRAIREWGAVTQEQRSCSLERWSIWSCGLDPDTMPIIAFDPEPWEEVCHAGTKFPDAARGRPDQGADCQRRIRHTGRHLDFDLDTGRIRAVWP